MTFRWSKPVPDRVVHLGAGASIEGAKLDIAAGLREVECRCGATYRRWTIKKTRHFICCECGNDLRPLAKAIDEAQP